MEIELRATIPHEGQTSRRGAYKTQMKGTAERLLKALYGDSVPPKDELTNAELLRAVTESPGFKALERSRPSDNTILRAAKRRVT